MATSEQISRVYQEELGRAPSASEIKFHQDAGSSLADIRASEEAARYRYRTGVASDADIADVVRGITGSHQSTRGWSPDMWKLAEDIANERGDDEWVTRARRGWATAQVRRESAVQYGTDDDRSYSSSGSFNTWQQNRLDELMNGTGDAPMDFTPDQEQSYQQGAAEQHGGGIWGRADALFGTHEFRDIADDVIPKEVYAGMQIGTLGIGNALLGTSTTTRETADILGDDVVAATNIGREVVLTAVDVLSAGTLTPITTGIRIAVAAGQYGTGQTSFKDALTTSAFAIGGAVANIQLGKLADAGRLGGALTTGAAYGATNFVLGAGESYVRTGDFSEAMEQGAIRGGSAGLAAGISSAVKGPAVPEAAATPGASLGDSQLQLTDVEPLAGTVGDSQLQLTDAGAPTSAGEGLSLGGADETSALFGEAPTEEFIPISEELGKTLPPKSGAPTAAEQTGVSGTTRSPSAEPTTQASIAKQAEEANRSLLTSAREKIGKTTDNLKKALGLGKEEPGWLSTIDPSSEAERAVLDLYYKGLPSDRADLLLSLARGSKGVTAKDIMATGIPLIEKSPGSGGLFSILGNDTFWKAAGVIAPAYLTWKGIQLTKETSDEQLRLQEEEIDANLEATMAYYDQAIAASEESETGPSVAPSVSFM